MPADWSLIGFGAAAAARNGLTNIAPLSDPTQYVVEATNFAKFSRPGEIFAHEVITAAIANLVKADFRKDNDRNYMRHMQGRDQTTPPNSQSFLQLRYPVKSNERLEFRADNGNNSQIEAGYFAFGRSKPISLFPPISAYRLIHATATATLTANLPWTSSGTVTWSETFDPNKRYKIIGLGGHSATLYALRLVFPDSNWRPGCPGCDLVGDMQMFWGDFGDFIGNTPPTFEFSASAGDTAENIALAVI